MPVQLTQLLAERAEVPVEWNDQTLTVSYNPAKVTTRLFESLEGDESPRSFSLMLIAMETAWDAVDAEGTPIDLSLERLLDLPFPLVKHLALSITEDVRVGKSSSTGG